MSAHRRRRRHSRISGNHAERGRQPGPGFQSARRQPVGNGIRIVIQIQIRIRFSPGFDLPMLRSQDCADDPGTEGAHIPFWSPDSRSIAFFAQGKLKKVDPLLAPLLMYRISTTDGEVTPVTPAFRPPRCDTKAANPPRFLDRVSDRQACNCQAISPLCP